VVVRDDYDEGQILISNQGDCPGRPWQVVRPLGNPTAIVGVQHRQEILVSSALRNNRLVCVKEESVINARTRLPELWAIAVAVLAQMVWKLLEPPLPAFQIRPAVGGAPGNVLRGPRSHK
jgi:hypothetical protein